ncbi:hypothetical protein [Arthrobacter ruber]|uniref:hypothetical protein n=1 Tax=Arthrobacter ruber TaxID=1258893 RepID=UPI00197AAF07|nr:hypothetical protein [Arthrobacter ruber]
MSINSTNDRSVTQDARAWQKFTEGKHTAALRQMRSPFAQGLLGERVSARQLISTLRDHPLIGADEGDFVLGHMGFYADDLFTFDGEKDYIQLALVVEVLRMFSLEDPATPPSVGSYRLKHTVEKFLPSPYSYVTNGQLIWAAAALDLPIAEYDTDGGPNLLIGIPDREHEYVRAMVEGGANQPKAHHFRPPGFAYLQDALRRCAAGERVEDEWEKPAAGKVSAPFHDWLIAQAERDNPVGTFAGDYAEGVRRSEHRFTSTPDDLLTLLTEVSRSSEAYDAARTAIGEWLETTPQPKGVRTPTISATSEAVGYGERAGTTERIEFRCPCGDGMIVEEHDNIPGFRDHSVWIECSKCSDEWSFLDGQPTRGWALQPVL